MRPGPSSCGAPVCLPGSLAPVGGAVLLSQPCSLPLPPLPHTVQGRLHTPPKLGFLVCSFSGVMERAVAFVSPCPKLFRPPGLRLGLAPWPAVLLPPVSLTLSQGQAPPDPELPSPGTGGPARDPVAPWVTARRSLRLCFPQLLPRDGEFVLASGAGFSAQDASRDQGCGTGEAPRAGSGGGGEGDQGGACPGGVSGRGPVGGGPPARLRDSRPPRRPRALPRPRPLLLARPPPVALRGRGARPVLRGRRARALPPRRRRLSVRRLLPSGPGRDPRPRARPQRPGSGPGELARAGPGLGSPLRASARAVPLPARRRPCQAPPVSSEHSKAAPPPTPAPLVTRPPADVHARRGPGAVPGVPRRPPALPRAGRSERGLRGLRRAVGLRLRQRGGEWGPQRLAGARSGRGSARGGGPLGAGARRPASAAAVWPSRFPADRRPPPAAALDLRRPAPAPGRSLPPDRLP